MSTKSKILIVDDDPDYLKLCGSALKRSFSVLTASSSEEAKKLLSLTPDIMLIDIRLDDTDPGNKEGIELLKFVKSQMSGIPVIMNTAYGDVDIAVEAMKLGAADFIQKGKVDHGEIWRRILDVLEKSRLQRRVSELEEDLDRLEPREMIGDDPKILEIKKLIDLVAGDGEITVLIRGATGTGKALVARAIHKRGIRRNEPFVSVAIPSLSASLIESELFGHERGAFTSADRKKTGYIEQAHRGVLLLDEIGELGREAQVKLLRFLDNKTLIRVGGTEEIQVDVQLVAATNRDLEKAVKEGNFREDLYYRLKTFQIALPALADRVNDIPKLAYHFLRFLKSDGRTKLDKISDSVTKLLEQYNWPGNVRELRNCIERAVIYAEDHGHNQIMPDDLPFEIRRSPDKGHTSLISGLPQKGINIMEELARVELAYIEEALKMTDGKKTEAWKVLGYNDRFALRRRVKSILQKFPDLINEFPSLR